VAQHFEFRRHRTVEPVVKLARAERRDGLLEVENCRLAVGDVGGANFTTL